MDVSLVKSAGFGTAVQIIDAKGANAYPVEYEGCSVNLPPGYNEITMHLTGAPDPTDANAILAGVDLPTCAHALLAITVNAGTFLVNDVTNVVADPTLEKTLKVTLACVDATGDLEVVVYEKTEESDYAENPPAGRTHAADLKEYTLAAAGVSLQEVANFIR